MGPTYFAARRFTEHMLKGSAETDFNPLIKEITDRLYRNIQDSFENFLLNDTDANIQGYIWRLVDDIVEGMLKGEKWIIDRYALSTRYPIEEVRKSLFQMAGDDLKGIYIAELKKTIASLEGINRDLTDQIRIERDNRFSATGNEPVIS